ncbi:hypothetical protein RIF29_43243 [Crotalaria pallida]|uniref:Uncharacterized protein n=1 Tax=Crotalaria pallida TaxID=3830 RepID=A0AAN9HKD9_CROPI
MYYKLKKKKKEGGFKNARSKNISFRGTSDKYSMVRGFGGSLDRDQPFIPGCIDIPLFFILVIGTARVKKIRDSIKYL